MLIKNRTIIQEGFINAFAKLIEVEMPAKKCLEVSKSIEEIIAHYNTVRRVLQSIVNKYSLKDENNVPKVDENGNIMFENEEAKEKCNSEVTEILDEEIDISLSSKVKISGNTKMTPLVYKLLEDIIEVD